jgi:hypothetical protein
MIPTVLAALSYAPKDDALANRVGCLCEAYLRGGDVVLTPRLALLPDRYCGARLAHDFMATGRDGLWQAGAAWAKANGQPSFGRVTRGNAAW